MRLYASHKSCFPGLHLMRLPFLMVRRMFGIIKEVWGPLHVGAKSFLKAELGAVKEAPSSNCWLASVIEGGGGGGACVAPLEGVAGL